MKTTLTLIELADMINDHLDAGGVVIDTYREQEVNIVGDALYVEDEYGARLHLSDRGTRLSTTIPSSDILTLEGHEVAYTSCPYFGYLGRIAFLNPAPVDLPPRDVAAAYAAYAAAVSRCRRAVEARDAAADADIEAARDARDAAAAADAARAAYETTNEAANAAYEDMVAAKAALVAATGTD